MMEYRTAGGQIRRRVSLEATNNARLVSPSDFESVYMHKTMDKPGVGYNARVRVIGSRTVHASKTTQKHLALRPPLPKAIIQS